MLMIDCDFFDDSDCDDDDYNGEQNHPQKLQFRGFVNLKFMF